MNKSAFHRSRSVRGFTLIEVMVAIGIAGVMASMAIPNMRTFTVNMQAKNAAFELIGDLTMARSEALKRNSNVTVTPVGTSWSNGWRVSVGGTVIRERAALPTSLRLGAPTTGITFASSGRLADTDTNTGLLKWSVSSTEERTSSRCIVITPTGSPRARSGSCTESTVQTG